MYNLLLFCLFFQSGELKVILVHGKEFPPKDNEEVICDLSDDDKFNDVYCFKLGITYSTRFVTCYIFASPRIQAV